MYVGSLNEEARLHDNVGPAAAWQFISHKEGDQIMRVYLKTAVAVIVATLPLQLGAVPQKVSEPLTAREVQKAEKEAKTAADHLRLAAYYRLEAQQDQKKLADAEDTMKHWSFMENWTKLPNAYSSSKTQADAYRAKFDNATKLAADHEKMAQSLQASR
jgi:hypothetical protein